MKEFFKELFGYNKMVNEKIIAVLSNHQGSVPARANEVAGHIFLVHQSWNNRMLGKEGLTNLWKILDPETMTALNSDSTSASLRIINEFELQDEFTYRNSKGDVFKNKYQDVLFHLINHSSYHRGQVNAALRSAAIEPVITDYIFYKR